MTKEFKGLEPVENTDDAVKSLDTDFPEGTVMRLTVKKYLWAVTGAIGVDVPIGTWEDVNCLVEDWVDFIADLEETYADELTDIYSRAPSKSRSSSSRPSGGKTGGGVLSAVRGKMFDLATKKGVRVKARYPKFMDWSVRDIEDFIEELEEMPDKGEDAGKAATSRVQRARSSRRR